MPRRHPLLDLVMEPHFVGTLPASEIRDREWCSRCLPNQDKTAAKQNEVERTQHLATVFWTNAKLRGKPYVVLPGEGV